MPSVKACFLLFSASLSEISASPRPIGSLSYLAQKLNAPMLMDPTERGEAEISRRLAEEEHKAGQAFLKSISGMLY